MSEYICCDFDLAEGIDCRELEQIVRCRDCEYARHYHPLDYRTGRPHETLEEWYCTWHSNAEGASDIEPCGFCAWGERKDA